MLVDGEGERGRDAFTEVVTVQEVGEYGAEPTTQEGECNYGDAYPGNGLVKSILLEECGRHANENTDDAVVERFPVGKTIDDVRKETDNNCGERTAEHGGKQCADIV